jgi:hypothetical protein
MLYIIEFICAVLFIAGAALFGVFALSKLLAVLLAACLVVFFVRIEAPKGMLFVAAGFVVCGLVVVGAHVVATAF